LIAGLARPPTVSQREGDQRGVLEQSSLVALADQEIRKLILAGDLVPGQRVVEARLGERLGVSRPPLREAMRMLAVRGILEHTPRHGYRVAELDGQDLEEINALLAKLEEFALERAVSSLHGDAFVPLDDIMAEMWTAARGGDGLAVLEVSREFHIELVGLAGSARLSTLHRMVVDQLRLGVAQPPPGVAQPSDLFASCRRHELLLDAVRSRNLDDIGVALAQHAEWACPVS
jgi:DNA-binding GntR family transcriptional regulator